MNEAHFDHSSMHDQQQPEDTVSELVIFPNQVPTTEILFASTKGATFGDGRSQRGGIPGPVLPPGSKGPRLGRVAATAGGVALAAAAALGGVWGYNKMSQGEEDVESGRGGATTPVEQPSSTVQVGGGEVNGDAGPTVENTSPTAEPTAETPDFNSLPYELVKPHAYQGITLATTDTVTSPARIKPELVQGRDITVAGLGEVYIDQGFDDENSTAEQKVQTAIYKTLYTGYKIRNPESSITLDEYIQIAEEGKNSGAEPQFKYTVQGVVNSFGVKSDIEISEQTEFTFAPVGEEVVNEGFAFPYEGYKFNLREKSGAYYLEAWSYAQGAIAPEFYLPDKDFRKSDYEMTNVFVASLVIMLTDPSFSTGANLKPEQIDTLTTITNFVGADLYKGEMYTLEGAIKVKPIE